jgi:hypothetical protein
MLPGRDSLLELDTSLNAVFLLADLPRISLFIDSMTLLNNRFMIAMLLADSEFAIDTAELERMYELDKTQSLPNHEVLAMSGHVVDRFPQRNEATDMFKSRVFG